MYSGSGFSRSELGDVDVVHHAGLYHLFHLVLPNHDYIAHAVSEDGFSWRRVRNAIFIGDPGEWDDDMLWTMHVTRNPDVPGEWRMFYTGLCRKEEGRVQRVGLARSTDLYHWEKDRSGNYPLELKGPHYESSVKEGRQWVSFRDPFFYHEGEHRLLLANGRSTDGPLIRRGCVACFSEAEADRFELREPLFFPRMYDDVEVPALFRLNGRYYLAGSLREDVKVHYWHSPSPLGPFEAFYDNLLVPQGNYAARVMANEDGRHLLWNFFTNTQEEVYEKLLPPPKMLDTRPDGQLMVRSFPGFDDKVEEVSCAREIHPLWRMLKNPNAEEDRLLENNTLRLSCRSGYELYALQSTYQNFRLRSRMDMGKKGKTGMFFRCDQEANGYFISLDLVNALAQVRHWGIRGRGLFDRSFNYCNMQEHHFALDPDLGYEIELIAFGGYIELSINGVVTLSLIDTTYPHEGNLGFYVESATVELPHLEVQCLRGPVKEDYGPI